MDECNSNEPNPQITYRLVPNQHTDSKNTDSKLMLLAVSELATARGWKIIELRRTAGSLEEVFTTLTAT